MTTPWKPTANTDRGRRLPRHRAAYHAHPTNHAHTNQTGSPNHPSANLTVTTYQPANATYPEPTHPWQDPDHASADPNNGVPNSLTTQATAAPTTFSEKARNSRVDAYVSNVRLPSPPTLSAVPTPTAANPSLPTTTQRTHPRRTPATVPPTTDPNTRTATVDTDPAPTPPRAPNTNTHDHHPPPPRNHPTHPRQTPHRYTFPVFCNDARQPTRVARLYRDRRQTFIYALTCAFTAMVWCGSRRPERAENVLVIGQQTLSSNGLGRGNG